MAVQNNGEHVCQVTSSCSCYFRSCSCSCSRIAAAILRLGGQTTPEDHLSFYCLGKREGVEDVPDGLEEPAPCSGAELTRESLSHPIYVHKLSQQAELCLQYLQK